MFEINTARSHISFMNAFVYLNGLSITAWLARFLEMLALFYNRSALLCSANHHAQIHESRTSGNHKIVLPKCVFDASDIWYVVASKLANVDVNNVFNQQDGATCHTACQNVTLLHEKRHGRVIFPLLVCFMSDYVKSEVYGNKP